VFICVYMSTCVHVRICVQLLTNPIMVFVCEQALELTELTSVCKVLHLYVCICVDVCNCCLLT
jgi:hypothetical protein